MLSTIRPFPRLALFSLALLLANPAWAELKLTGRWPVDDKACADSPLRLTFDQPPVLGEGGKIEVCRAADGKPVETITLGAGPQADAFGDISGPVLRYEALQIDGTTASVRLRSRSLGYGEAYFVRIGPGVFKDFAGVTEGWKFTTKPALPRYTRRRSG